MPRIDVAVRYSDGRSEVVSVGRPADLIAFADKFGRVAPEPPYAVQELAWLTHRALRAEQPLDEWVEELDDLSSADDAVAEVRRVADPSDNGAAPATEPATSSGSESLA